MADERRDRGERRRQRLSVDLTNTPFALAADNSYSTTLRAFTRGDWEGEIPEAIFYMGGERLGRAVPVQDRYATKATTGLGPGRHYLAEVAIGGQRAERLLIVPELPKRPPKTLSVERIGRKPNLQFAVSLTAADGRGTKGVVEAICLGYGLKRVEVDESGSRVWPDAPIDFPEKMRRYRFRITGTDVADKNATKECVVF